MTTDTINIHKNAHNLDLAVFQSISSQTSDGDKTSLLACRNAAANLVDSYVYLEIGSYLGGSLQPFLLDEKCRLIYSLDKRPAMQADERGLDYIYKNNSTARMLENLKKVSPDLSKIVTIDGDVSEISPEKIVNKPHLCFIDGEHTDPAVFADFRFCLQVCASNAAILFHDAATIYNGLQNIIGFLNEKQIKFNAYNLPDVMFVIEIGDFPLHREPAVGQMLLNNHVGYLASLQMNDGYRSFVNKPGIRHYRKFRTWLSKSNISE